MYNTYHFRLVDDDNIGKLDLVDHEIRDSALVLGQDVVAARREHIVRVEVVEHGEGVDHRHRGIQTRKLVEATSGRP
jgi:hypothetical protein